MAKREELQCCQVMAGPLNDDGIPAKCGLPAIARWCWPRENRKVEWLYVCEEHDGHVTEVEEQKEADDD